MSRYNACSERLRTLRSETNAARQSFLESLMATPATKQPLTTNQVASTLPGNMRIAQKAVTPKDVVAQDNAVPLAQTANGDIVMTDPKTGQLIVVAKDPHAIAVKTPEEVAGLQQMAQATKANQQAKQGPNQVPVTPQDQLTAQKAELAKKQSAQATERAKSNGRLSEGISEFIAELNSLLSEHPLGVLELVGNREETTKKPEKEDTEDGSDDNSGEDTEEIPTDTDGLVAVVTDPNDALSALGADFWGMPGGEDLLSVAAQAQANMGLSPAVKIDPNHTVAKPAQLSSKAETDPDDFSSVLGMDGGPFSIKLAISIG